MKSISRILIFIVLMSMPFHAKALVVGYSRASVGGSGCTGTYGRDTGASQNSANTNQIVLMKITFDCSGTIDYIEQDLVSANTSDREVKFVVYDDDGTAGEPSTRLYVSSAVFGSDGFISSGTGVGLGITPGDYWIGGIYESSITQMKFQSASGDARLVINGDFNPPATFPTGGVTTSTAERVIRAGF